MGFSERQMRALQRNPDRRYIRTREANGKELSYIEGWYAISEANRIFGFDGWNRETVDSKCILTRENRGTFHAIYIARVRVTVQADGALIIREGHGSGQGQGTSPGEVHDTAFKAAETDATKRALTTFGKPFGLALYRAPKRNAPKQVSTEKAEINDHQVLTTFSPKAQPEQPAKTFEQREIAELQEDALQQPANASAVAAAHPAGKIDKSLLTIGEPKRLRSKAHLRFIATQPCLICGRRPSDAHHLKFAQPRALGLKVSDEFTVPLCRGHHRQLHDGGDEAAWWDDLDVNALEIAKGLWDQSHGR